MAMSRSNEGPLSATPLSWGWIHPCDAAFLLAKRQPVEPATEDLKPTEDGHTDMSKTTDKSSGKRISRRTLLQGAAGTAALLGAVQSQFPFGAHVAMAAGPRSRAPSLASSR